MPMRAVLLYGMTIQLVGLLEELRIELRQLCCVSELFVPFCET